MGQGGDVCEDALREAGDVIAVERPAENRRSCNAHGSRVGSKDCDQLGCPHPTGPDMGGRGGHGWTPLHCHCCKRTICSERLMNLPLLLLQPVPCPPAPSSKWAQGTQAAAEKGLGRTASRTASRATGRYLQQPEGTEALEGQRRDALQGVVTEDPAEGKKEATQRRGHHCVCCKKPTLGCTFTLV